MMTARIVTAKGRPSARRAAGTMTSVRNVRGPAMSSAIRAAAKSRMEIMNTSGEGTGNMSEAPERIWATEDADLYTITICACEAGQSKAAQIAAMTTQNKEN